MGRLSRTAGGQAGCCCPSGGGHRIALHGCPSSNDAPNPLASQALPVTVLILLTHNLQGPALRGRAAGGASIRNDLDRQALRLRVRHSKRVGPARSRAVSVSRRVVHPDLIANLVTVVGIVELRSQGKWASNQHMCVAHARQLCVRC